MRKVALLFSGQGSQYVGMGKKLYDRYEVARELFDTAEETLGFQLKNLCFEGDMQELTKTENAQPAILTVGVAAYKVYMQEFGIEANCMAGHSLGEITALTCSGAIRFEDAVQIVHRRGQFMQQASQEGIGGMAAVSKLSQSTIAEICEEISEDNKTVVISNINSGNQIVISGHLTAVNQAMDRMKKMGALTTLLPVSASFHSPLMVEAGKQLEEELGRYTYHDLKIPVISNVNAQFYQGKECIIENLCKQIVEPVQWQKTMLLLKQQSIGMVFELGTKEVLKNLAKENEGSFAAYAFDNESDIEAAKKAINSNQDSLNQVNKQQKRTLIIRCLAIAVCTKNQNWNNDSYHEGVVVPYKKIKQMLEDLEREDAEPTKGQMQQAIDMLISVFQTKFTLKEEQKERFQQLFDESGTRSLFPNFEEGLNQ